jgi:hypothetical protein
MRHQGVECDRLAGSTLFLNAIIEISSLVILHHSTRRSGQRIQRSVTAWLTTAAQMAALRPGEAYVGQQARGLCAKAVSCTPAGNQAWRRTKRLIAKRERHQ